MLKAVIFTVMNGEIPAYFTARRKMLVIASQNSSSLLLKVSAELIFS
jgi:hypothetical protein